MFKQHTLLVDALSKVQLGMNKILVGRYRLGKSAMYLIFEQYGLPKYI